MLGAVLALLALPACEQASEPAAAGSSAPKECDGTEPPVPAEVADGVTMEGTVPDDALAVSLAGAVPAHEVFVSVSGMTLPLDLSSEDATSGQNDPQPQFLTVESSADGSAIACHRTASIAPIVVHDLGRPLTVTLTSAPGEPDAGTLTLDVDGESLEEEDADDGGMSLLESIYGYEVTLEWEDTGAPGYAVVVDTASQPGSKRPARSNRYRFVLPAGEEAKVAVYPLEELEPEAVDAAPSIIPGSDVTTITTPDS